MNCPRCGKEVLEGTKFCPSCGGKIGDILSPQQSQPATQQSVYHPPTAADAPFQRDKFLFNQKKFSVRPQYYVYDEEKNPVCFIRRTLFALKRHTYIYSDESQKNPLFTVLQDRIFMIFFAWFTLVDNEGEIIAKFRRRNFISILRRTWDILDAEGNIVGSAVEDSWGKALFRRFGPLGEFFKTDFIITFGGRQIGKYIRRWTLFDKYALDLTGDPQRAFDRRAALALGTLLDSGESR